MRSSQSVCRVNVLVVAICSVLELLIDCCRDLAVPYLQQRPVNVGAIDYVHTFSAIVQLHLATLQLEFAMRSGPRCVRRMSNAYGECP